MTTSSEESDKEESEEAMDDPSVQSPSGDTNATEITQEKCRQGTNLCSEVKSELADNDISEPTGNADNGLS